MPDRHSSGASGAPKSTLLPHDPGAPQNLLTVRRRLSSARAITGNAVKALSCANENASAPLQTLCKKRMTAHPMTANPGGTYRSWKSVRSFALSGIPLRDDYRTRHRAPWDPLVAMPPYARTSREYLED